MAKAIAVPEPVRNSSDFIVSLMSGLPRPIVDDSLRAVELDEVFGGPKDPRTPAGMVLWFKDYPTNPVEKMYDEYRRGMERIRKQNFHPIEATYVGRIVNVTQGMPRSLGMFNGGKLLSVSNLPVGGRVHSSVHGMCVVALNSVGYGGRSQCCVQKIALVPVSEVLPRL